MKLYRHMALSTFSAIYAIWIIALPLLGPDSGTGWAIGYSLFMPLMLYLSQPDFSRYLTFGLSTRVWNGHRRLNASIALVLILVSAPFAFPWWVLIAPVLAWIVCMVKQFEPSRMTAKSLIAGSDGDSSTGVFSASPVAQIVLRPQVRAWMWMTFGAFLAIAATLAIIQLWGKNVGFVGTIVTLIVVPILMDSVRSSLKDAVTFGVPRAAWAKTTLLCTVIPVGLAAVADLIFAVVTGNLAGFTVVFLAATSLLLSFAITDKQTWLYTVVLAGLNAAIFLTWLINSTVPMEWALAGMAVVYLAWIVAYPRMAKRANVFSPGLMGWFGAS